MTQVDVRALAALARLAVSDEEAAKLEREIPEILSLVEMIQKADVSGVRESKTLQSVMRDDVMAHESGQYTERLLAAAPARAGNRIAVKQVVSRRSSHGGAASAEH